MNLFSGYKAILVLLLFITFSAAVELFGAEKLNRGLVAYRSTENNVKYVNISWRYLSSDDPATQYNIYMAKVYSSGTMQSYVKINDTPVAGKSFYKYEDKNLLAACYVLKEVINGEEKDSIGSYLMKGVGEAGSNYITIPMKQIAGDDAWAYAPNDATAADLDGDGELELVIHRAGKGQDNANSGITDAPVLQAYKLDGTFLWEINLGVNIREGAHYTQFMVYDLDGDSKAEVVCKTAEGSKDAVGTPVGKAYFPEYKANYGFSVNYNENAVYRNSGGYILQGPEFLTVFNGETGREVVTTEYDPPRYSTWNNGNEIPKLTQTGTELNSRWGDNYGNRVDRFLACVANLGGENHSVVMCRGYYTRTVLVAYDFKDGKLTRRWKFDTWTGSGNTNYAGQGNHNLRVGDVDGDGYDEIVYGSMTVDHNGKGLYNTRLGHGDALHLSDYIPERPGMEVMAVHESGGNGTTLRDARTGEVIFKVPSSDDVGRGMGSDVDPRSRGMEWWSARTGGIRSAVTGEVVSSTSVSMNMAAWWDGDLLREMQDGTGVTKTDPVLNARTTLLDASAECSSNNSTKANPCLAADVTGDWREEVILRTSDNKNVRIYLTTVPTTYRFHTFLEDPVYRMSVVYQNVAYNQPTHTGFYFGSDLEHIFQNKDITITESNHEVDPVFDAVSYKWSTGETTKKITLNSADYSAGQDNKVWLDMNFRGYLFTDTLTFRFMTTGVDKLWAKNEIQLIENPVKQILQLKFNISGKFNLQVYNAAGQLCMQQPVSTLRSSIQQVNVADLHKGVFLVNISNETHRYTIRFIKH
ncbi:MAG: T9SS type A sorting domain-containing protein [Bacteroidia bacterium]|nr:T9SS type A sorting domain-containing protein [Bacteroidia bacterium]